MTDKIEPGRQNYLVMAPLVGQNYLGKRTEMTPVAVFQYHGVLWASWNANARHAGCSLRCSFTSMEVFPGSVSVFPEFVSIFPDCVSTF